LDVPDVVHVCPEAQEGATRGDRESLDQVAPALTFGVSGADDETRTRDPHLGNCLADVLMVSAGLRGALELHVLGARVSSVSPDRSSRLDFVGDFVGVDASSPGCRAQRTVGGLPAGLRADAEEQRRRKDRHQITAGIDRMAE
jgi:hypothetical protein